MKCLNAHELMNIKGGAVSAGVWFGIVSGVSFIIGFIDGLLRPLRCR